MLDMWWRPIRPASGFIDVPDSHSFATDVAWLAANGYTDGCNPPLNTLFCPDTHVTRGQTAAFLHRALNGIVEPSGDPIDFTDDDDSTFVADIAWLSATGITKGCSATEYCPDDSVTRGQMAAFLVRALGYTDDEGGDLFVDDNDSIFETDIDRLATAGVTLGCNPPVNDRYCPNDLVTRGAMAAFLVRALSYVDSGGGDLFVDDDGHTFENDIDKLATAGVTKGCNPPTNDRYCPDDFVTRGQMAAFLHRALGT